MSAVIEKRGFSHSLTRLIGALAALVLLGVSAAMNYLFLSALGKTPVEAHVLGAASAAADLLKAVLPFLIFWAWRAGRISVALPGLLVWALFTVFSLLSAIGFAAGNREAVSDSRTATAQRYETVRLNLAAALKEREALPEHRARAIVAAAIEAHKQHRRWASTKSCRNATVPDSRTYCRAYFALRAELAAAKKNAALAAKIEDLRAQAWGLREAGGKREPEPQVELLARLFGLERDPVRLALILLIAGLVELGAGLGLYLSMSGTSVIRQAPTQQRLARQRKNRSARSDANGPEVGEIADFVWDCLEPAASAGCILTEDELWAGYQRWCTANRYRFLSRRAFVSAFQSLATEIGMERHGKVYNALRFASHDHMEFFERFTEG